MSILSAEALVVLDLIDDCYKDFVSDLFSFKIFDLSAICTPECSRLFDSATLK